MVIHEFCSCGFPHSEICGSKGACPSPQLFAACHVLHRLEVPRHPPCALSSLTIKFTQNNKLQKSGVRIQKSEFSFLLLYSSFFVLHSPSSNLTDACTLNLPCVFSLLSDVHFKNPKIHEVTSDNSHYSIFKELKLTFDQVSKLQSLIIFKLRTQLPALFSKRRSKIRNILVEARGFEPLTPALQTRCSAS